MMALVYNLEMKVERKGKVRKVRHTCPSERAADEKQLEELAKGSKVLDAQIFRERTR